jgi:hypothetical protein
LIMQQKHWVRFSCPYQCRGNEIKPGLVWIIAVA